MQQRQQDFHDYTLASRLEKFIAVLEQTLKSWDAAGLDAIVSQAFSAQLREQPALVKVQASLKHRLTWRSEPYLLQLHLPTAQLMHCSPAAPAPGGAAAAAAGPLAAPGTPPPHHASTSFHHAGAGAEGGAGGGAPGSGPSPWEVGVEVEVGQGLQLILQELMEEEAAELRGEGGEGGEPHELKLKRLELGQGQ
ncbi:hypothetical protein QJQ45_029761, partial [Haematococcus lacustris]